MKILKVITLIILSLLVLLFGFNVLISLFGLIFNSDALNNGAEGIGYFIGYMSVQIIALGLALWGWIMTLKSIKKKKKTNKSVSE